MTAIFSFTQRELEIAAIAVISGCALSTKKILTSGSTVSTLLFVEIDIDLLLYFFTYQEPPQHNEVDFKVFSYSQVTVHMFQQRQHLKTNRYENLTGRDGLKIEPKWRITRNSICNTLKWPRQINATSEVFAKVFCTTVQLFKRPDDLELWSIRNQHSFFTIHRQKCSLCLIPAVHSSPVSSGSAGLFLRKAAGYRA